MPPRFSFLLAVILLSLLASCRSPAPRSLSEADCPDCNLVLRNYGGRVVMLARFELPREPLTPGKNFLGAWYPMEADAQVPHVWKANEQGAVKYHAEIAAEDMSVDLTFGDADDNLYLLGHPENGHYAGVWYHGTATGAQTMGDFTLRTAPAKPTSSP
ncbi:MAG TPA: hypothetical protein VHC95_01805 [Opitutales bacterium]|nr:hypothetical protein [Opitutales bacterium]